MKFIKFVILHEETDLYLTFSFTSFKIEFNPLTIRQTIICKKFSTENNISNAPVLTYFSFTEGVEKFHGC